MQTYTNIINHTEVNILNYKTETYETHHSLYKAFSNTEP
jgi:hypothetical protein